MPEAVPRATTTRTLAGSASQVVGYAATIAMLAVASLAMIPAMITASGDTAWGSVALGQSIGAIAATAIAYGWGITGPASIARASQEGRLSEFFESLAARGALFIPVASLAMGAAALMTPAHPGFAAAGAAQAATVGLTANWYFAGTRSAYVLLVVETIPRVAGSALGIAIMQQGASAAAGVLAQGAGMLVAVGLSAVAVRASLPTTSVRRRRSVLASLSEQRHGIGTSLGSAAYVATPIVIVSLVAPAAQPLYALADKLQRQIAIAFGPLTTAMQGWVPQGPAHALRRRARRATVAGAAIAVVAAIAVMLGGPVLLQQLGGDGIAVPMIIVVLMAAFTAVSVFENMLAEAVLPAIGLTRSSARATIASAVIGLPLVAAGAMLDGARGALLGVIAGLLARTVAELLAARRQAVPVDDAS